jgi:hypothetical protein
MTFPLMPTMAPQQTPDVNIENTDGSFSSSNAFTYTFSNRAIGAAAAGRIVAVCATTNAISSTTYGISSITIGGIAATMAVRSSGNKNAAIAYAMVATGTTATIVVNLTGSGTPGRCGIGVFRITGYTNPAPIVASGFSDTPEPNLFVPIDVPNGAKAIASIYVGNNGNSSFFEMGPPFNRVNSFYVESTWLGTGMSGTGVGASATSNPPLPWGTTTALLIPSGSTVDMSMSVAAWR